jgi:uncharacterized protein (TIGR02391 family)
VEKSINDIVPDPEVLLALEPEDVAGVVLEYLNGLPERSGQFNRHNFGLPHTVQKYPPQYQQRISRALMEGWVWLQREGLIAPKPGETGDWVFVTRRGQLLKTREDLKAYQTASPLPRQLLHPTLATKVVAPFVRGDYDVAVLQAFKEVELAVRKAGGFPDKAYGTMLMRRAFDPRKGPLRDPDGPLAEREATAYLFAGAIGLFKNPQGHRHAPITDPGEAVELLVLASHLLRLAASRAGARAKHGAG